MRFSKYHAAGNDYLVLEEDPAAVTAAAVRALCARSTGVGADGVLVEVPAADGFGLRIVNPDGSEAGVSGNGLRIFARWLADRGRVGDASFRVAAPGRTVRCRVLPGRGEVEVGMGRPDFARDRVPVRCAGAELIDAPLELGDGTTLRVTAVSMGNPHAVAPVARTSEALARALGPRVERHPLFPDRANVQFVEVLGRDRLRVEVWERGAGYTLASGSSACAAAAALRRLGRCDDAVRVEMPGGTLHVRFGADGAATLRGPVARVAEGTAHLDEGPIAAP